MPGLPWLLHTRPSLQSHADSLSCAAALTFCSEACYLHALCSYLATGSSTRAFYQKVNHPFCYSIIKDFLFPWLREKGGDIPFKSWLGRLLLFHHLFPLPSREINCRTMTFPIYTWFSWCPPFPLNKFVLDKRSCESHGLATVPAG